LVLASVLTLRGCFALLPEARGLVTNGPYRLVRHPVYLGELGACASLVIAAPSVFNSVLLATFVLAQWGRMGFEERALTAAFPEYSRYAEETPGLIPVWFGRRGRGAQLRESLVRSSS
jgi:protein-S-isoprenylcysteine O-methyltransferase Ste14